MEQVTGVERGGWLLLPWKQVRDLVEVLRFGANKHSPEGWKQRPNARGYYFDRLMSHASKWAGGEDLDPETGKSHMIHAASNALILAWHATGAGDEHQLGGGANGGEMELLAEPPDGRCAQEFMRPKEATAEFLRMANEVKDTHGLAWLQIAAERLGVVPSFLRAVVAGTQLVDVATLAESRRRFEESALKQGVLEDRAPEVDE